MRILKSLSWRLLNMAFRLISPHLWIQNERTCYAWDKKLNELLDSNQIELGGLTIKLGGHEIWVGNFPYAYGSPYGVRVRDEVLPAPITRYRLRNMLSKCKPAEEKVLIPAKQKAPKPRKSIACAHAGCDRRFVDKNAMRNHLRTFHIDKVALRDKQEKDKKLNAIRNAAPAMLDTLEKILPELRSLAIFSEAAKKYADMAEVAIKLAKGDL